LGGVITVFRADAVHHGWVTTGVTITTHAGRGECIECLSYFPLGFRLFFFEMLSGLTCSLYSEKNGPEEKGSTSEEKHTSTPWVYSPPSTAAN
jgi:hypothetical protein